MYPSSQPPTPQIVVAFQDLLEKCRRYNWKGQEFYHPNDIRRWMRSRDTPDALSNGGKLLRTTFECAQPNKPFEEINSEHISGSLIVFATLLSIDYKCGWLVIEFRRHHIDDAALHLEHLFHSGHDLLHTLNKHIIDHTRSINIIERFEEERWKFAPASFTFDMDVQFNGDQCILPFCFRDIVNIKGGTANIHRYKIQSDLLDEDFKDAIAKSRHNYGKFGEVWASAP